MIFNKTIAAVSTPRGVGGVAMIRISGADTEEIARRCFQSAGSMMPCRETARRAIYGTVVDGAGHAVDDVVATFFAAPASYTGEDTLEITCHGGTYVTARVLGAVFEAGADQAEKGEFTRRAYVNGRLSLSRAEAIANVISAANENQLKLAVSGAAGTFGRRVAELSAPLKDLLAASYAILDYPDEELDSAAAENMSAILNEAAVGIETLAATYRTGRAVADGVRTVICGAPNAGKSSVYNRLAGADRAIVTDIAGTTRDILEDTVSVGGVTLRLSDTAGLRDSDDPVEKIGIDRAIDRLADAELILAVYDGSRPLEKEDLGVIERVKNAADALRIALVNKGDKAYALSADEEAAIRDAHGNVIFVSAVTGEGFADLAAAVEQAFLDGAIDLSRDPVAASERQHASLTAALRAVRSAADALEAGLPADVVLFEAEEAVRELEMSDGRAVSEEIVNTIFARFCVGK